MTVDDKACVATKRRFQHCTVVYFRTLEGHSRRNLIDPSLQDNVAIPNKFFQFNFGSIPGGQKFEQETNNVHSAC